MDKNSKTTTLENPKVLIVDDQPFFVTMLKDQLSLMGYEVLAAYSGTEALKLAMKNQPDLILLDVVLPDIDGFKVCHSIKSSPQTDHIPVLMLTALTDVKSKHKGLKAGAIDFLSKPIDQDELSYKIENVIKLKDQQKFLQNRTKLLEDIIEDKICEVQDAFNDSINRLTLAAEYRDDDTALHIKRVGHYVRVLAQTLDFDEDQIELLECASPMHDVGKIGIKEGILMKPGKLTEEEFEEMKTHTFIGGKILGGAKSELLKSAEKFALYHHERWDGSGYPHQLRGDDIPIEGRLMFMADIYDALRSRRSYKPSYDHDEVYKIITKGNKETRPTYFDPLILEAFKGNHTKFADIFDNMIENIPPAST